MKLYDNIDNNINYESINIKLRKINDTICDSIIKKTDGYYCRIVCGYKPYDAKHTYGDNVIHNGLYMIYPLPQNEIQEFKLDNFIPPKLLDGNSLITVDSFNSTNPSEFTIKVPIDRRYMAHKEYVEGQNIFLEARKDRNYNKTIQIKEIYNDTNSYIGTQPNISLTNNNTEIVTFCKENEDEAKLKLLSIEGNTVQNSSDLSKIVSIGESQEDNPYKIEILLSDVLPSHEFKWTEYIFLDRESFWYTKCSNDFHYEGKITNIFDKPIHVDTRDKDTKQWVQRYAIAAKQSINTSIFGKTQEFYSFKFMRGYGWSEASLPSEEQLYSTLGGSTHSHFTTKTIKIPQPLRAINDFKDKLYLKDNKYFIDNKIGNININDFTFQGKASRAQTLKFYFDTNIPSADSTVIGCLPNNITCESEDISGMYMSTDQPGRITISIPLSALNNDISDDSIKQYFNNRNPEILFVRKFSNIIETDITSPILLDTIIDNNFISINNEVKGVIDLEIYYNEYNASLIVSNDEKHLNQLTTRNINLPRALKPNEIYSWDDHRKHYTIKKNVIKEKYQNFLNDCAFSSDMLCWLDETSIDINSKRWKDKSGNNNDFELKGTFDDTSFTDKGIAFNHSRNNSAISLNSFPLYEYQNQTGFTFEYYGTTQNAGSGGWKRYVQVGTDINNRHCYAALLYNSDAGNTPVKNIINVSVDHINKLIHLVISIEPMAIGSKVRWYVNGSLFKEETVKTAPSTKNILEKIFISQSESGTDYSSQFIKTIRFYKTALSGFEVKSRYFDLTQSDSISGDFANKLLISKQLEDAYYLDWIKSGSVTENKLLMQHVKGINTDCYFNIINIPEEIVSYKIRTIQKEQYFTYQNFDHLKRFNGRINDQKVLVQDNSCATYYMIIHTDSVFNLFVKGGNTLKIGYIQQADFPKDGDRIEGLIDYTNQINEEGTLLRIDLNQIIPIRNSFRCLVINTNNIDSLESHPCTDFFVIDKAINLYENTMYDDIEYFEDRNEIIAIEYEKIKEHEESYAGTLTINDWRINELGEIEKTEDGKAYSAIALCDPKDSFKISGNIDICLYAFLDKNYELIAYNNALTDVEQEVITTADAPKGTKYCLFYLNTEGLLKERDINLILQSFQKSSEIDNYIKIENNPTISVSAPYKKIRPLDAPTNIVAVDQKTSLVITWDEVLGAKEYVVFLEEKVLEIVTTNKLELFRELRGNVSIKAINDLIESPLSDRKFIHSVPRNPFIIYIDNIYENNKYTFDVTFKDNSELETAYKLKYIVDEREEETIDLPGYEGTGTLVKGSFSSVAIDSRVRVRVLAVNDQGENEVAPYIEMRMPPDITWAYKEDSKQLVVSWLNTFPESDLYLLRYKLENAEHFSTQTILNEYAKNARISAYLPLKPNEKMTISLAATVREDLPHIFSKPIQCCADKDVNLVAPLNFKSKKIANNQIEFSWTDNHGVEDGWELALTLNNTESETIFIPSTSVQSSGSRITHTYTFPTFGFVEAKLRMKWALGVSRYTETLMNYYFEVINTPPHGIKRAYLNDNMIKFEWTPQNHVDHYNFFIKKKTDSEFKTITVTAPEYYFENFEEVDYVYNIQTEFLGEITSDKTKDFEFKPTIGSNSNIMNITNKFEKAFAFAERTTTKMLDKYDLVTKSIKQDTSIKYPINMYSTTEFTMVKGLIAIETWGVGQRTEGLTNADIINKKIEIVNPINTISYKETSALSPLATTIITPTTNNYMVLMEINKTRIVCFGDSITAGHPGYWAESGTGDIEHSYPYWLDRRLKFKYEVINKGYGSDRTYDLLNRMDKDVIALNPQYCLIQIGTNDIYWGAAGANGSKEAFEEVLNGMKNNMRTLVKKCMDNGIKPIIGQLIPRTQSVTDELVKYGLYSFNEWIVEYANTTEGLNYIDFFNAGKDSIPPTPLEDPNSPGAMNPIYDGDNIYDEMGHLVQYGAGIHLNKPGYKIMAEAIPLNLFNDYTTGLKLYLDKDCTMEAEYNIDDKQNPYYRIAIEAMQLTRTKKIVRYIKNVGIGQTLFALYPTKIYNLKYSFKTEDMEKGEDTAYGILSPGKSIAVIIELTPQTEDSKSEFELSLVGREFLIKS